MRDSDIAQTFKNPITIAGRSIGEDSPVLVIAEAGVAHFGDAGKARDLVDLAADAGADVFKTQAFRTEALFADSMPDWRERMAPKEVGPDFLAGMKDRCEERGLIFLCTPHDETVIDWLLDLDVPAFKIGSGERGNLPFLHRLAEIGKPVIISTGMHRQRDVQDALTAIGSAGCREAALLHCVTSYPTPYEQLNLRAMEQLRSLFAGPVGYSDHTDGHHAALAAVALGARIIEKHISLDFNIPNAQDWKVSAGPEDLADFVCKIREVEAALGSGEKEIQPCEEEAIDWAVKKLVAARAIPAGAVLTADCLVAKRLATGISPALMDDVLGKRVIRELAADEAITWETLN